MHLNPMKTLTLSEFKKHPQAVARLTSRGERVRITNKGQPVWIVSSAPHPETPADIPEIERSAWIDAYLDELTGSHQASAPSISDLVLQSRGER